MPPTHTDEGIVAAKESAGHPDVGVLVLSHHLDSRYAMQLLEEHPEASGYLLKERVSDVAVLVDALQRVGEGECVIDPTIVVATGARPREPGPLDRLSDREREVLALMAEGRSNQAICDSSSSARRPSRRTSSHVFVKLGPGETPDDHRRVLAVLTYLRG